MNTAIEILHEKILGNPILNMYWCHSMDLIAVITKNNKIQLFKISFQIQKVFQKEETSEISICTFSPNEKYFLYSTAGGKIHIIKTEDGELYFDLNSAEDVTYCQWNNFHKLKDPRVLSPMRYTERINDLILDLVPFENNQKNLMQKLGFLKSQDEQLSSVVTVNGNGGIKISINVLFPIGIIERSLYAPNELNEGQELISIIQTEKNRSIFLFLLLDETFDKDGPQKKYKNQDLTLIEIDTSVLHTFTEPLSIISHQLSTLNSHLTYTKLTFKKIGKMLRQILLAFNSKILILGDAIKKDTIDSTPRETLLDFVQTGQINQALQDFLARELFDCKILARMEEKITMIFDEVQEFVSQYTINTIERMIVHVGYLKSIAMDGSEAQFLGLDLAELEDFSEDLDEMLARCHSFLLKTTDSKFDVKNFCCWLNKSVIKTVQENEIEIENLKFDMNQYKFSLARLINFLSSDDLFQFDELLSYFSGEQIIENKKSNEFFNQPLKEIEEIVTGNGGKKKGKNSMEVEGQVNIQREVFKYMMDGLDLRSQKDANPDQIDLENKENSGKRKRTHNQPFTVLLQILEGKFKKIYERPCQQISKLFTKKQTILLSTMPQGSHLFSTTTQELLGKQDFFYFAFLTQKFVQSTRIECLVVFKRSGHKNHLALIQIPDNYFLKELLVVDNKQLAVLLCSKQNLSVQAGPHSIFGILYFDDLTFMEIKAKGEELNFKQMIFEQIQERTQMNGMMLKKNIKINSVNLRGIRNSLRGLLSVIQDENKIIVME